MKETNAWLSSEELQHMLQGSLLWIDVASRVTISKTGIRKLSDYPPREKDKPSKRLEGQPVIWLLGSVGLLTLSSWFYYVLFAK